MSAPARHVVIIGASLAGTRTAQGLRTYGFDGRITLVGAESELPYDRPPLSKDLLKTEWAEDSPASVRLAGEEELRDLDIELTLGTAAISLDTARKTITLADDTELDYDIAVVATGAGARPSPWQPTSGLYQLRTLEDAAAISDRLTRGGSLIVVGGGFIGTEIAAAARSRGCDVTVVDPVLEPMTRLVGPEVAAHLVDLHRRHGTQTRFGRGVVGIEGEEGDVTVTLDDGETLHADAVVVGIGSLPHTEWLRGSALTLDNGVVTDASLRAIGVEDVYALGDVARWPHPERGALVRAEHWTNASDQARYLAEALARGTDSRYVPSDYVWSDQYDWKVHTVGWRDPEGSSLIIGDLESDGRVAVIHADAAGAACGAVTVNWVKALNHLRRMLATGGSAAELVEQLRQRV